ncbi:MAG: universal stress protein [Pirellulaceae bacterium]|nr:universal stress protein [Pirellulaceae bacterium]
MQAFHKILVAVDCSRFESGQSALSTLPELQRALQIARYSGATLHVVDVLRDLNMAARLLSQWQAEHQKLSEEKQSKLSELATLCEAGGVRTTSQLLHGNFSQQLLQVIQDRQIDLLIRPAKGLRSAESGAIGATSSQLLRRAACALWLTQGERSAGCTHILAAVDATPDDEAHAALNRIILQRSLDLVKREGCQLHIAYAWDIYDSELLRGRLPESQFDEMIERNRLCHEESYERELSEFGLHTSDSNVHMLRGAATQVIPDFCRQHQIDLLVCGTVARGGLSGLMIGNTANRMLSKVPCSILALR